MTGMGPPRINEEGLYRGDNCYVKGNYETAAGGNGFAILWQQRTLIGIFGSKEVANGIAATFDALVPVGGPSDDPPVDSLLELVGFRHILADVVGREAKRLEAAELATRAAANRLRGRSWP